MFNNHVLIIFLQAKQRTNWKPSCANRTGGIIHSPFVSLLDNIFSHFYAFHFFAICATYLISLRCYLNLHDFLYVIGLINSRLLCTFGIDIASVSWLLKMRPLPFADCLVLVTSVPMAFRNYWYVTLGGLYHDFGQTFQNFSVPLNYNFADNFEVLYFEMSWFDASRLDEIQNWVLGKFD